VAMLMLRWCFPADRDPRQQLWNEPHTYITRPAFGKENILQGRKKGMVHTISMRADCLHIAGQ
jgi:hypothetical protein